MSLKNLRAAPSLHRQIKTVKAQLAENKTAFVVQSSLLTRRVHSRITAPTTLCLAGFSGFMLAEFNYRPVQKDKCASDDKIRKQHENYQVRTNQAIRNERSAKAKDSEKALSGQWSLANINQILNSSAQIMTFINSSLLCLKEMSHPKVANAETIKGDRMVVV